MAAGIDADETADDADEAWAAGLEVLLDLATTVIEDAHESAVAAASTDPRAQLIRVEALRQAGADLIALADASEVLIRRHHRG